jgi:hypothetical protein
VEVGEHIVGAGEIQASIGQGKLALVRIELDLHRATAGLEPGRLLVHTKFVVKLSVPESFAPMAATRWRRYAVLRRRV